MKKLHLIRWSFFMDSVALSGLWPVGIDDRWTAPDPRDNQAGILVGRISLTMDGVSRDKHKVTGLCVDDVLAAWSRLHAQGSRQNIDHRVELIMVVPA